MAIGLKIIGTSYLGRLRFSRYDFTTFLGYLFTIHYMSTIYQHLYYSHKLHGADKHLVEGMVRPEQPELLRGADKAGDQQVAGVGQHVHQPLCTENTIRS